MAKKLPLKKQVSEKSVDHPEVKKAVTIEKSNYGVKETIAEKGTQEEPEASSANRVPVGKAEVGLSKGITINLGNYESARINCWITRIVNDDDTEMMNSLAELSGLIDEQIQFEVDGINDLKNG